MKADYWAYIGIGFVCLYFLATCDGCDDKIDSETYDNVEVISDGYQQSSLMFSNEQDVRIYLCSCRFVSNDGTKLSFSNNANSVFMNGTQLASSVDVLVQSYDCALVRTHGPYGNTTLQISISGGEGVIVDGNSGDTYYSK